MKIAYLAVMLLLVFFSAGSPGLVAAQEVACPLRLGGLAPLTEPGALIPGEAIRAGMQIAIEEINRNGGVLGCEVELIVGDTGGLPEIGAGVIEQLIQDEGVVAVAGGYHSSVALSMIEVAVANDMPVLFAEPWADEVTTPQYDHIFRLAPINSDVAAANIAFISALPGIENVAIVTENTAFGIPNAQGTATGLSDAGIESVIFSVDIGAQDYVDIVEAIRALDPDLTVVLLTGDASFDFTQQAADAGFGPQDNPMICFEDAVDSEAFWENVPDGNLCFVVKIGLPQALFGPTARSVQQRYFEATGKELVGNFALSAYDAIMLLAMAIEQARSVEPDAIAAALETIEYEGALGPIRFPINSANPPEAAGVADKYWHQFLNPAITFIQYQQTGQAASDAPVVFPETYRTGDPVMP